MSVQRLRTAVVGLGFVGPHHVDAVRRGGYADVVAIVGSDAARTAARASELGVPRSTADVHEVLADPSIDVVHICTPNATHVDLVTAALEAGKHVVCEKPLAPTAAEARSLVDLAERRSRHAAVAFTYRGYPMVRRAREIIGSGEAGDVRLVHGTYLQDWLLEETDYNWRLEAGAGGPSRAVADIGSHWFDTVEFVTGRRIETLVADLATFLTERTRPSRAGTSFTAAEGETERVPVESEDAATILVRLAGGARGACVVSQVSPGRKNAFSLEIAASRRSVAWHQEEPNELWLGARDTGGSSIVPREPGAAATPGVPALPAGHPEGWSEALRDLFRPFYRAIAAGEPPRRPGESAGYPTFSDGARAAAFVEAVLESSRAGAWVPVHGGAPVASSTG